MANILEASVDPETGLLGSLAKVVGPSMPNGPCGTSWSVGATMSLDGFNTDGSKFYDEWYCTTHDSISAAYSARDVAGVLRALRLGRVDLYGDSYGSWFAQVFASRYAAQLRSVTLDSTYQVLGLDPWYTTTVITARQAFTQACERSRACQSAAGPRSQARRSSGR